MNKLIKYTESRESLIVEILLEKLDLFETPNVLKSIDLVVSEKMPKYLVIDLTTVDMIDSSGIGMLLALRNSIGKRQIPLRIVAENDQVLKVFSLTKMDQIMEIYSTVDEAVSY